ncbi:hypothetical protein JHD53_06070 [Peptacetobacter hiranonis]|uniref:hypothetical protein n=1 Tax=Peptacetobacter hiranonis TaxID=89152 RepID=UPI001916E0FF|nr:hypothetical protein [Peptacetobacter hiranonis]QQQ85562.1 hypothetical protein JHD53_06070 [Peptacetobacter hiranonis]
MIKKYLHDGDKYDQNLFYSEGFVLDYNDLKMDLGNIYSKEKYKSIDKFIDFVGFVENDDNDLLVVFPKNYKVLNCEEDSKILFNCISKHIQKRPDMYIGENGDKNFTSNYPFAAFYGVYDYFANYGLYLKNKFFIKPNTGGRLNWKETLNKSEKFINYEDIILFPLYYNKNHYFSNLITDCMIFVIDYTIYKFNTFINLSPTGKSFPGVDFIDKKEDILSILMQLKQQTFKDNEQQLIENLICYFSEVNIGGHFYLKHYSFSSIWEDMIKDYLCNFYKEINSSHEIVLDKNNPRKLVFQKKSFHVNAAKPTQYISPDYYCESENTQLIFDAKYYSDIKGMDYKQISYLFMLSGMKDSITDKKKFKKTYSALILPSEKRFTKIHFQIDSMYNDTYDFIITEEYMDIRDVMISFCK